MNNQTCNNYDIIPESRSYFTPKIFKPLESHKIHGLAYLKNSLENNGFTDYISHPLKIVEDFNRKPSICDNPSTKTVESKFFNGIWITDKNNPKLVIGDLDNFLTQAKKINEYKVIIHTNISPEKLIEHNPQLELEGVTVKNIAELNTEHPQLLDLVISPEKHLNFDGNIKNSRFLGVLIDLTKYLVLESNGGVVADFNFHFFKDFKPSNLELNDFIGILKQPFRLENGFFSTTKPHHIIFKELLNIIDQMLNNDCALENLKSKSIDTITELFSMLPLSMAYMKYNNIENNNDSLMHYNCQHHNNINQNYSSDLLEKNIKHEAMVDKFYSYEFNEFSLFVESYDNILTELIPYYGFNCIESSIIGEDNNMAASWH